MSHERAAGWDRAVAERARSQSLRARAIELRRRADLLSATLVATMRNHQGRPLGERGNSFFLRLPALPVTLGLMRQELSRWLSRRGVSGADAADITLACSEACANAMEHALFSEQAAVEIEARAHASDIEIVVRDFGNWAPETDQGNRGRGLAMIRALTDDVEIERDENGTRVSMRRRLRSGGAQLDSTNGTTNST